MAVRAALRAILAGPVSGALLFVRHASRDDEIHNVRDGMAGTRNLHAQHDCEDPNEGEQPDPGLGHSAAASRAEHDSENTPRVCTMQRRATRRELGKSAAARDWHPEQDERERLPRGKLQNGAKEWPDRAARAHNVGAIVQGCVQAHSGALGEGRSTLRLYDIGLQRNDYG